MPDKARLSEELALYTTLSPEECMARFTALSADERVALYKVGADILAALLTDLPEAGLDRSIAPGAWTIRQIVHHLADGEGVWSVCLRMALGVPGASAQFDWYPGNDEWAQALDYAGRPIEAALALFRAQRLHTAQLLEHMGHRWEQRVLVGGQPMRVVDIACLLTAHAAEHVAEIRKIREQGGI